MAHESFCGSNFPRIFKDNPRSFGSTTYTPPHPGIWLQLHHFWGQRSLHKSSPLLISLRSVTKHVCQINRHPAIPSRSMFFCCQPHRSSCQWWIPKSLWASTDVLRMNKDGQSHVYFVPQTSSKQGAPAHVHSSAQLCCQWWQRFTTWLMTASETDLIRKMKIWTHDTRDKIWRCWNQEARSSAAKGWSKCVCCWFIKLDE